MDELRDGMRLAVARESMAQGIREGLANGMTPKAIGETLGLKATVVRQLIIAWKLQ